MKCLVTGGAGFIGSHLVDALINEDHKVVVIDDLSSGKKENINPVAKFVKLDIRDKKIKKIFDQEKPEIVFHLAAQKNIKISVKDPCLDADINIVGSLNLLENCRKNKIKVIFSSTGGAIYGDTKNRPTPENENELPISPYGVAKLTIEKYLYYYQQVFSLPFVSLRYANVYGPRQDPIGEAGVVAIFLEKMLTGIQPMINGDGCQTRDYVFVTDVVAANLKAMKPEVKGVYNIGTGVETNVNCLFNEIIRLGNFSFEEKHGPPIIGEQLTSSLDTQKAKTVFSWFPKILLEEGLKITLDWFRKKDGR